MLYQVVPFIGQLKTGVFSSENAGKVSDQLEELINKYVREGWEYVGIEQVQIAVKPGCLASLFGSRESVISFDQVIFRRAV